MLQTFDLKTFDFASGYQPHVMTSAIDFTTCKSFYDPEFDLNYAAPGSVLQDPTLPPGNLIMFYEAENHCPGSAASSIAPVWQRAFYATVGFARSSDNGKTWPQPIDSEFGGADRHPVLKGPVAQPPTNFPGAMGDAIPSAFVDGSHLYVVYTYAAGAQSDGLIRIARAKLDGDGHDSGEDFDSATKNHGQLKFLKWHNGAFSEPGIGGMDSGVVPASGLSWQTGDARTQLQRRSRPVSDDIRLQQQLSRRPRRLVFFDGDQSRTSGLDGAAADPEFTSSDHQSV